MYSVNAVVTYCEDYKDVLCKSYLIDKHKKCKIPRITEASASYNITNLESFVDKVVKLKDEFSEVIKKTLLQVENPQMAKDECEHDIRKYRQELE